MLQSFIRAADADRPVYICDVRDAFLREGDRPFHFHVRLYDGSVRPFALRVPRCRDGEESRFTASFLNAMVHNALSALGAREIAVYVDPADAKLAAFARSLGDTFQVNAPIASRMGYGKCLNVNQRTLTALFGPEARFRFTADGLSAEPAVPAPQPGVPGAPVFASLPRRAERGMWMGMDIGGTDVKVAASLDGRLCALREYDWSPAEFTRAEQLLEPLLLLARLTRAIVNLEARGMGECIPAEALDRSAGYPALLRATLAMEAALAQPPRGFDGIGLCFPDVVIRNRIVGGETPKTQGMRENPDADYEAQFARVAGLCDRLREYVVPGGAVLNTNDGPMAAFTTAVEQAAAGRELSDGFFAHTLGTDLGTGWILPDGSIPEMPMEVYNCIVDLGSRGQRRYAAGDARSMLNFNNGLPGTLQKCACQTGVFRLAAGRLPEADPALFSRALDEGLFAWDGSRLTVPTAPRDMRKPCLEFFMGAAEDPRSPAAELFRGVGESVAAAWRETDYLLRPTCRSRTLFGRLVKTRACFDLILEGARRIVPDIALEVADEGLANTGLMKQLAAHPTCTVAQFAQAVGAIHYACLGA